jgi:putative membrane protein
MGRGMLLSKFAGPMMSRGYEGFSRGFGAEGIIFSVIHLVFWLIIITIAVRLLKHYFPQSPWKSSSKDQAYEILRERYAKGEIDSEEFSIRKKELGL